MDPPSAETPLEHHYLDTKLLCDIWVFSDFRDIPRLGNSALHMLHERWVAEWQTPIMSSSTCTTTACLDLSCVHFSSTGSA
ncbi:hypothetical protein BU25DRAFT_468413 [Macroventuria anomochaeta]|uniref:Uncharacterized protein n=1 Tax=Macroventuria anomochaeta TaxID=301207 RepID=A0ACB6S359_9PLEO|nr:uncharacterized protein BU25DRAFT_468413 [Macroventuria anomochaeta]KAF2627562.1 hypothetical protein BU25DRAFT_468413 [Macroventuria anomochaeta]